MFALVSIYLFVNYFFYFFRYDRKERTIIKLIEIQLMCAMAPPIAGKDVTSRFKRHFFVLGISEFEDNVMITIFSRIVLWHLDTRFVRYRNIQ